MPESESAWMKLSAMLVLDAWTKLTTTETSKRTSHPKRVQEQRFERVLVGELTVVVKHCVAAGVGVRGVDPDGPDALREGCASERGYSCCLLFRADAGEENDTGICWKARADEKLKEGPAAAYAVGVSRAKDWKRGS